MSLAMVRVGAASWLCRSVRVRLHLDGRSPKHGEAIRCQSRSNVQSEDGPKLITTSVKLKFGVEVELNVTRRQQ